MLKFLKMTVVVVPEETITEEVLEEEAVVDLEEIEMTVDLAQEHHLMVADLVLEIILPEKMVFLEAANLQKELLEMKGATIFQQEAPKVIRNLDLEDLEEVNTNC